MAWSDMGGEFHDSEVRIVQSSFLFFPSPSAEFRDDDNDALYLYQSEPPGSDTAWSIVDSSVFYNGQDDGIDHNGVLLKVQFTRIGSFVNEGVAASSMGLARIENSVLENCAQGAEAGYGAPLLELRRVLLRSNGTGARLGDSYGDWAHQGRLYIDSSAFAANGLDILNLPGDTETVQEAQVWVGASQLRTGKDFGGKSNTIPSADEYARAAYEWTLESYTTGPVEEVKLWFEP